MATEQKSRRGPGRPPGNRADGGGREALILAARALLAETGVARLTLRAVAERAGVRPTLVSYYFDGKADLLGAVVERVAGEVKERLENVGKAEGDPETRLRLFISTFVHALADDPYAARLVAEHVLFPDDEVTDRFAREVAGPNLATLLSILAEGRAAGVFDDLDDRFAGPAVIGACIFFFLGAPLLRRVLGEDLLTPASVAGYADYAAEVLARGLRRPAES